MKAATFSLALATIFGLALWLAWPRAGAGPLEQPATADPAAGQVLYQANCASCHGNRLQGAPNWQTAGPDGVFPAPPHDRTGHTWHHGDALLFTYTKLGGKEIMARRGLEGASGMPGFGATLSDRQIWDILAYIKSTWPPRARAFQSERTRAEHGNDG